MRPACRGSAGRAEALLRTRVALLRTHAAEHVVGIRSFGSAFVAAQ